MKELYSLDPKLNNQYYQKIALVSLYGLAHGYTKNPFDLIDEPSNYEKSEGNRKGSTLAMGRISKMLRIFGNQGESFVLARCTSCSYSSDLLLGDSVKDNPVRIGV